MSSTVLQPLSSVLTLRLADTDILCIGALRLNIVRCHFSTSDKTKFDVRAKGKGGYDPEIRWEFRAAHHVEAERWFWAVNNAVQYARRQESREGFDANSGHLASTQLL